MKTKASLFAAGMLLAALTSGFAQPVITIQPQSQTKVVGSTLTLAVEATGTPPLSYQWRRGSVAVVGETNSTLAFTNLQSSHAGNYTVVITNIEGAVTSSVAFVRVLVPPAVTAQPTNQTVTVGETVTWSVTATGTLPLAYQWRFNDTSLPGKTNNTLTLTNAQPANGGGYFVVVTNAAGTATSQVATLTVLLAIHQFTQFELLSNQTARLTFSSPVPTPFRSFYDIFVLERSDNLVDWMPLPTLLRTNASTNAVVYLETGLTNAPRRFYRTPTNQFHTPILTPTGPLRVGTFTRVFSDPSRTNRYGIPSNSSFVVTFWYPAEARAGMLPGFYEELAEAQYFGSPLMAAHAISNAPLASVQPTYPVVIYSQGYTGFRRENTDKFEELASHGFVVLSLDHVDAAISVFPDGTVVHGTGISTTNAYFSRLLDFRFVLGQLEELNQTDAFFSGRLDLQRVGAMGFSLGGDVAGEFCRTESRCQAAVFLDNGIGSYTGLGQFGLQKPFLVMNSQNAPWLPSVASFFAKATNDAFSFQITNTIHDDFTDGAWFQPSSSRRQAADIMRTCARSFFKKHLRNEDDHLLDDPAVVFSGWILNFQKK